MEALDWFMIQFTGEQAIGNLASIATMSAVIYSVVRYFKNRDKDRNLASKNLYLELKDTLNSLDGLNYKSNSYSVVIKNEKGENMEVYFINRDFNHDVYDSMVFSGMINILEPELQQSIQDIFKRIKMHNKFLTAAREMETLDDPIPKESYKYYIWMNENEMQLEYEIKNMLEKLRTSFNYLRA